MKMKIALGALVLILLVSWGVFGFLWYSGNATKNQVGSTVKDKDLETCVPLDMAVINQKLEEGIPNITSKIISADIDMETTEGQEKILEFIAADVASMTDNMKIYCASEANIYRPQLEAGLAIAVRAVDEAKMKADVASSKAKMASTVPAVIVCLDKVDAFVNAPVAGDEICKGDNSRLWPDLEESGGSWTGCDMEINRESGEFNYCGTTGGKTYTCNVSGCNL